MRKRDELSDPNSCMNRARDDEWTFVLLGRDVAATRAVKAWIAARIAAGKNRPDDPQIQEARQWVAAVLAEQGRPDFDIPVGSARIWEALHCSTAETNILEAAKEQLDDLGADRDWHQFRAAGLAAALAEREAECQRLRACLEGTGHRLASWAEQADLLRLGMEATRDGLAAALAPPAEGGGFTTPDDYRRFVERVAAMDVPRWDGGHLDMLIRQARSLMAGEGGGE